MLGSVPVAVYHRCCQILRRSEGRPQRCSCSSPSESTPLCESGFAGATSTPTLKHKAIARSNGSSCSDCCLLNSRWIFGNDWCSRPSASLWSLVPWHEHGASTSNSSSRQMDALSRNGGSSLPTNYHLHIEQPIEACGFGG
jgi:hypothetical protein